MRPCSSCTCFIMSFRFFIMSVDLAVIGGIGEAAQEVGIAHVRDLGAWEFLKHGPDHRMFARLEKLGVAQGARLLAKRRLAQLTRHRHHPAFARPGLELPRKLANEARRSPLLKPDLEGSPGQT